ncbi:MAG: hypothetical protein CM15mP84_10510 [Cellvibrionales bacterium]|nr:MAG: hypothetical protein CM15mP84_10510 [Cellvibrionales bacterium]
MHLMFFFLSREIAQPSWLERAADIDCTVGLYGLLLRAPIVSPKDSAQDDPLFILRGKRSEITQAT